MRIASHSTFLKDFFRDDTNSYLTLSGLSPGTEITLRFLDGDADLGNCSDCVEIFGACEAVNCMKLCCFLPYNTLTLITTGDKVTFRLYTNSGTQRVGFLFSYTGKNFGIILELMTKKLKH